MTAQNNAAGAPGGDTLELCLARWAGSNAQRQGVALTIEALACAGREIADIIARGPLDGALGAELGGHNSDGDAQKALDVRADEIVLKNLRRAPVAYYGSEEEEAILTLDPRGGFAVACDPVDGSSNIDANLAVATIFSIFPAHADGASASLLRKGTEQLAAGYIMYGPHVALMLTLGEGTDHFALDRASGNFRRVAAQLRIVPETREYAINSSNRRHWREPTRAFIDDCLEGAAGPRGKDFNMRWLACMAGEAHRIFLRGGVYLYPADRRKGYENGRLRLLYEAFPIAMLIEQAGGAATDGFLRILEQKAEALHQRTPLVFGSAEKVAHIASYYTGVPPQAEQAPLFGARGLFQA